LFRWSWDGDGVYETDWSSNPITHHQFLAPGDYTVRLQVMDQGGLTGEEQIGVEVTSIEIPEMQGMVPVVVSMLVILAGSAFLSRVRKKK
jgi:PKD repeat protein